MMELQRRFRLLRSERRERKANRKAIEANRRRELERVSMRSARRGHDFDNFV